MEWFSTGDVDKWGLLKCHNYNLIFEKEKNAFTTILQLVQPGQHLPEFTVPRAKSGRPGSHMGIQVLPGVR